jgi:ABC-type multidrug transport system fused ATPase/permease subunit
MSNKRYSIIKRYFGDKLRIVMFAALVIGLIELFSITLTYFILKILVDGTPEAFGSDYTWILKDDSVGLFVIVAILIIVGASMIRLEFTRRSNRLIYECSVDLAEELVTKKLNLPAASLLNISDSRMVDLLLVKVPTVVHGVLFPLHAAIGALTMLLPTMIVLTYINYKVLLISLGVVSLLYLVAVRFLASRVRTNSSIINDEGRNLADTVINYIVRPRYLLTYPIAKTFLSNVVNSSRKKGFASADNITATAAPKIVLDGIIISSVIIFFALSSESQFSPENIADLAMFTVMTLRLIPVIQVMYSGFNSYRGSSASVDEVFEQLVSKEHSVGGLLQSEGCDSLCHSSELSLAKGWDLEVLKFSVGGRIFNPNMKVSVKAGSVLLISGESGSGKTSLLDVIMQINPDYHGKISIGDADLRDLSRGSLQRFFSYAGPDPLIIRGGLMENLFFGDYEETGGRPSLHNMDSLVKTIGMTEIVEMISTRGLLNPTDTFLSYGQRQRLCLLRATIRRPRVLVLDEALSGIPPDEEIRIIKGLKDIDPDLILVIVSHRPMTFDSDSEIRFVMPTHKHIQD